VLDIEMPNFNGLDLCRVVRQDPSWCDIGIVVLSAHTDAATVRQVYTVGADDYVSKPIVDAELVARLLNRLERVRTRR
jgi:DNA-binding response OmpR family regulator